jgi:hypothetical protein
VEAGRSDEKSLLSALINFALGITDFCFSLEMKLKYRLNDELKKANVNLLLLFLKFFSNILSIIFVFIKIILSRSNLLYFITLFS